MTRIVALAAVALTLLSTSQAFKLSDDIARAKADAAGAAVGVVPLSWSDLGNIANTQGYNMYGSPSVVTGPDGRVILGSARTDGSDLLSSGVSTDGYHFNSFNAIGYNQNPVKSMNPLVSLVEYYGKVYAFGSQTTPFNIQVSQYEAASSSFPTWSTLYTDGLRPVQNLACANFTSDADINYLVCTWQQSNSNDQYIGYVVGDTVMAGFTTNNYVVSLSAHTAYSVAIFQGPLFVGSERRNGLFIVWIDGTGNVMRFTATSNPTVGTSWQEGKMDITINSLVGVSGSVLPVTECENTVLIAYVNKSNNGSPIGNLAYFLFDTSMEFVSQPFPILSTTGEIVPAKFAPGFNFFNENLWLYSVNTTVATISQMDVFSTPVNEVLSRIKPACKQHRNKLGNQSTDQSSELHSQE